MTQDRKTEAGRELLAVGREMGFPRITWICALDQHSKRGGFTHDLWNEYDYKYFLDSDAPAEDVTAALALLEEVRETRWCAARRAFMHEWVIDGVPLGNPAVLRVTCTACGRTGKLRGVGQVDYTGS